MQNEPDDPKTHKEVHIKAHIGLLVAHETRLLSTSIHGAYCSKRRAPTHSPPPTSHIQLRAHTYTHTRTRARTCVAESSAFLFLIAGGGSHANIMHGTGLRMDSNAGTVSIFASLESSVRPVNPKTEHLALSGVSRKP